MGLGNFFGNLIGSATATGVGDVLNVAADAGLKVREIITGEPSPEKLLEAQTHLTDMLARLDEATIKVNEAEAKSNWFAGGWRPGIGWVCTISLAMYYPPRFALGMGFWAVKVYQTGSLMPLPEMGIQEVLGLVGTLLGMATLRSIDKNNGTHNDH